MNKLFFILMLSSSAILSFASTQPDLKMSYTNQRGSQLEMILHSTSKKAGTISGFFKTAVASPNCQDVIGKLQPINGFYTGNVITLSLSYPTCGSAVAMVGNFDKNKKLEMLWFVAKQAQDTTGKDWNTHLIGYDDYVPTDRKS